VQDFPRSARVFLARCAVLAMAAIAACFAVAQPGQKTSQPSPTTPPDVQFTAATPLGTDVLRLVPGGEVLDLMLTLESKELDGVKLTHTASGITLKDRDGQDVKYFPDELSFRFTVGSRTKLVDHEPMETEFDGSQQEFEDTLQFRLKIFHGIDQTEIEPEAQRIVGVPLEMPYDERIYRIRFKLPHHLPATDRMMLEIIDSEDERVSKFPVQLL
jgi:hypothetical protein